MKLLTKTLIVSLSFCLLSGISEAKSVDTRLDADINYWFSELDGKVQVTDAGLSGTKIDLVNDLGVDDSENIPNFTLSYRLFENSKISFSYFDVENEGSKSINQVFNYKGNTYTVGATVTSSLDLTVIEGRYGYRFLGTDKYDLYGLIGVKYAKVKAELNNTSFGTKKEEITAPVPVVGISAEVRPFNKFAIGGEITGLTISTGSVDFTLIDALANVGYDISDNFRASLGYRYLNIDGSDGDDSVEVTYQGPYAAIVGSF